MRDEYGFRRPEREYPHAGAGDHHGMFELRDNLPCQSEGGLTSSARSGHSPTLGYVPDRGHSSFHVYVTDKLRDLVPCAAQISLLGSLQRHSRPLNVRVEGRLTFNSIERILDAALDGLDLGDIPEDMAAPRLRQDAHV